jgi:hypothetical protein
MFKHSMGRDENFWVETKQRLKLKRLPFQIVHSSHFWNTSIIALWGRSICTEGRKLWLGFRESFCLTCIQLSSVKQRQITNCRGTGQDENNGSQCKTNRLRAHQVVSSAHCIALQLHKRKQNFERPSLASGCIRMQMDKYTWNPCTFALWQHFFYLPRLVQESLSLLCFKLCACGNMAGLKN